MQLAHNHTLLYTVIHNLVTAGGLHETICCLCCRAKLRLGGQLGKRVPVTHYMLKLMLHAFAQNLVIETAAADAAASVLGWRVKLCFNLPTTSADHQAATGTLSLK